MSEDTSTDKVVGPKSLGLFYTQECVGGVWQGTVLIESPTGHGGVVKQAFTPAEGATEQEVINQIHERWPQAKLVTKKEFDQQLYDDLSPSSMMQGTGKRMVQRAVVSHGHMEQLPGGRKITDIKGNFFEEPRLRKRTTPVAPRRPGPDKAPIPDDLGDNDLVAPVQAAKYLGVPSQYIYNRIYHGKLQAVGERPKLVKWGEVRRQFGV